MNSQIVWQLNGTNIEKTIQSSTKLFANGVASAEYVLLSNDVLKSDVVTIIANRGGDEFKYRLHYNNAIKLLDGTIVSGWHVISNGDELRVDLQTGTIDIAFNFDIKRYSLLDETSLIADYTTEQDIVTLYPASRYVPKAETTDVEQILKDLNDLEIKHNEDINSINEQLALKETIIKHNEDVAEINTQLDLKQNINDNELNTNDKTIVGAINEVKTAVDEKISDLDAIQNSLDNKVDKMSEFGAFYIDINDNGITLAEFLTGSLPPYIKVKPHDFELSNGTKVFNGGNIATQEDLNTKISEINAVQIRNKEPNLIITATTNTVQAVATQYIVDNYGRQPEMNDGLFITMTDKNNDVIEYAYLNSSWINIGLNDIDLSNYVDKTSLQTISGDKDFTGQLTKNGENVATKTYVDDLVSSTIGNVSALLGNTSDLEV